MTKVQDFLRESNAIEGVYDHTSLADALKAWDFLIQQETMDVDVILKTHKILMRRQKMKRTEVGHFRKIGVQVGMWVAPPWQYVPDMMAELAAAMNLIVHGEYWKEMHVKFEKIHPFVDGNGRIGRMLMNWHRIKKHNMPVLVIKESERQQYYLWFRT